MWPESLVGELAARRCVVFMGAGISAASGAPDGSLLPGWKCLLDSARLQLPQGADATIASELLGKERYLDAAEVIFSALDRGDRTGFLRKIFQNPLQPFQPSQLHKLVRDLDVKIVITTNFDTLYEQLCPNNEGYNVRHYTDGDLLDDVRSPIRLIVKAHGCITDPHNIVLTRSDYYRARSEHLNFYNILDALFLTNTILFVGCSLTDPDIQLTLENANIASPAGHTHFALMAAGTHAALSRSMRASYNIRIVEYDNASGDHAEAVSALEALAKDVTAYRSSILA